MSRNEDRINFSRMGTAAYELDPRELKFEILISNLETILNTNPCCFGFCSCNLNLFRISCLGLPWRDLPRTVRCRWNTSEVEAIEVGPSKPGLGQGFRHSARMRDI